MALGLLSCLSPAATSLWSLALLVPTSTVNCPRPRLLLSATCEVLSTAQDCKGESRGVGWSWGRTCAGCRCRWDLSLCKVHTPTFSNPTPQSTGCSSFNPLQVFNHFHVEPCQRCCLPPTPSFQTLELFPFCREGRAGRWWGTSPLMQGRAIPGAVRATPVRLRDGQEVQERPPCSGAALCTPSLLPVTDKTWQQSSGCLQVQTGRLRIWEEQGCGDSEHAQSRRSRADLLCPAGCGCHPWGCAGTRVPCPQLGRLITAWRETAPHLLKAVLGQHLHGHCKTHPPYPITASAPPWDAVPAQADRKRCPVPPGHHARGAKK